jgi:cell division protein FtsZ
MNKKSKSVLKAKKTVKPQRSFLMVKKNKFKKPLVISQSKPFKKNTSNTVGKKISQKVKKITTKKTVALLQKNTIRKAVSKPVIAQHKKNTTQNSEHHFSANSLFKAKIKVIGIGGGGGSIVSEIGRSLHKATFVVADTDMRALKKRAGIKYFLFGQDLTHGLGTGVNPDLGRRAAEQEKEKIAHFFEDQDIVIFIASLGGGLGSGATQIFAEAAKSFNGLTLGIFTLPFKFEGKNKYKIALKALGSLRKSLNVSITIPNEKIFKVIGANTAITDAFSMVNKHLIESLESLIDLIYNPGIINIDFADLRAILKGKGNVAFLNTAEAQGKDRAEQIAQKILHNPLYQNNNFITEKILFNIEGGENLSMFEVDKISRAISQENPKSKIIFGISKNTSLKNKIKTTLLMTGGGSAVEPKISHTEKVLKKELAVKKAQFQQKVKAPKPVVKKTSQHKKNKLTRQVAIKPKNIFSDVLPSFDVAFTEQNSMPVLARKLHIEQDNQKLPDQLQPSIIKARKAIRRTALDIKKAQQEEENKQSLQEKEWEIPAFLRLKK